MGTLIYTRIIIVLHFREEMTETYIFSFGQLFDYWAFILYPSFEIKYYLSVFMRFIICCDWLFNFNWLMNKTN